MYLALTLPIHDGETSIGNNYRYSSSKVGKNRWKELLVPKSSVRAGQIVSFSLTPFQRLGIILWVSRLCPVCYCFHWVILPFSWKVASIWSWVVLSAYVAASRVLVVWKPFVSNSLSLPVQASTISVEKKFFKNIGGSSTDFTGFQSIRQKLHPQAKGCRVINSVYCFYISFAVYCEILIS